MTRTLLLIALLCVAAFGQQQIAVYTLTMSVPNYVSIYSFNTTTGALAYVNQTLTFGNGPLVPIQSQGAIATAGDNFLLAVNPGSDTVSLFYIDPTNPFNLTFINQTATGGNFPISVTANNGNACVANSGTTNGLTCFTYNAKGIALIVGSFRTFGLTLTTPPATHTGPGQISFNPAGTLLVVSNKGANATNTPPVWAWSFLNGNVSATTVAVNHTAGVPFGFAFDQADPNQSLLLSDAAPTGGNGGVALLKYNSDLTNNPIPTISYATTYTIVPNATAACWVANYGENTFFVSNAGSGSISVVNTNSGNSPTVTIAQTFPINNGTVHPLDLMGMNVGGTNYLVFISTDGSLWSTPLNSDLTPTLSTLVRVPITSTNQPAGIASSFVLNATNPTTTGSTTGGVTTGGATTGTTSGSTSNSTSGSTTGVATTGTTTSTPSPTPSTGTPSPTPSTGTPSPTPSTGTPSPTPTTTGAPTSPIAVSPGTPSAPVPTTPTTTSPVPSPSGASSSIVSLFMALALVCYYLI